MINTQRIDMTREEDLKSQISIDSKGLATWDINMTGLIGGTYQGTFVFKSILTPLQEIEVDKDYRELLGKNAEFATTHADNLAYTLAQLRYRVVKAPPFFSDGVSKFPGGQIPDREVLQAILDAAIMAEMKYRDELKEKHKKSIQKLVKVLEEKEQEEKAALEKEKEG